MKPSDRKLSKVEKMAIKTFRDRHCKSDATTDMTEAQKERLRDDLEKIGKDEATISPEEDTIGYKRYVDELLRQALPVMGDRLLSMYEEYYKFTDNPAIVWQAISVASEYQRPLPIWVRKYLGAVAYMITDLLRNDDSPRKTKVGPKGSEAELVGRAAGFGKDRPGPGGKLLQAAQFQHDVSLCSEVEARLKHGGKGTKLEAVLYEVAQNHGVHKSTVNRAHKELKAWWDKLDDDS